MLNIPKRSVAPALSVHYAHPSCSELLTSAIYGFLRQLNPLLDRDVVYLCIGTDRATGDCLGPLVGTFLQESLSSLNLFGSLEHPAHAVNLPDVIEEIHSFYADPVIAAIDASLGSEDRVGYISVQKGSLTPGTALNKSLPTVGDFHISGVVNVGGYLEQMVLQNTRLFVVYRMAELITQGLSEAHILHNREMSSPSFPRHSYHPAAAQ